MRIESPYKAHLEDLPINDIPRPTKVPTTEEMVKMLDEAGRQPWVVQELRRLAIWRAESARKNIVIGGPGCGMCNEYGPHSH